jgi:hypothetical protein
MGFVAAALCRLDTQFQLSLFRDSHHCFLSFGPLSIYLDIKMATDSWDYMELLGMI